MDDWCAAVRRQRSEIFFYAGTAVLALKVLFPYSTLIQIPEILDSVLILLGISFFLCKIVFQEYTFGNLCVVMLLGMITLISAVQSRDYALLISMLVICSFQNIEPESFIREIFLIKVFFVLAHVGIYCIGRLTEHTNYVMSMVQKETECSFGMVHANFFSMLICWILLEWIYLNYEKLTFMGYFICEGISILVFIFSHSRTSFLISTFVILIIGLARYCRQIEKLILKISFFIYPFVAMISFFISVYYYEARGVIKKLLQLTNRILSGRFNMWAAARELYGFSLLGQKITGGGKLQWNEIYQITQLIVDNAYIYFAVKCGAAFIWIFSIFFFAVSTEKKTKKSIMIVAISIFSIAESFGGSIFLCFPICFIGCTLYKQRIEEKVRK